MPDPTPVLDATLTTYIGPPDDRGWRKVMRGDRVVFFAPLPNSSYVELWGRDAPWRRPCLETAIHYRDAVFRIAELLGVYPDFHTLLAAVCGPVEGAERRRHAVTNTKPNRSVKKAEALARVRQWAKDGTLMRMGALGRLCDAVSDARYFGATEAEIKKARAPRGRDA